MSNYTQTTAFTPKDSLSTGNPLKVIKGTEFDTEFGNIATAISSKANSTSPTLVTPILGTPISGTLTNCTGLPLSTGITGTLPIANGGTGTTSTAFANLATNVTGTLPVANGGTGITSLGTGVATFLGTPSSANLAAALTDETGSGAAVFATAPTLSGPTFNDGYTEEVFAVTGTTPALSPTNGSIQTWTLSANSTPTAGTWAAGQSITLMIDDGTAYSVTWSSVAVTWKTDSGNAPTLNTSGFTAIQLWKVGSTVYGARVGNA